MNLRDPQPPIRQLIDGGLKNSSPLGDVIKFMDDEQEDVAYRILIINSSSGKLAVERKEFNIVEIALRSLTEITLAEIFENDIREFVRVNALVRQARQQGVVLRDARGRPLRQFSYKIIQPEEELGEVFDATPTVLRRRYARGPTAGRKKPLRDGGNANWDGEDGCLGDISLGRLRFRRFDVPLL